ncbi:epoxyqueuosine reductase QueH [Helicobacter mehlei]|uniref:Epoxyqueuosine reductase QueH n=1 Tax=Helicobacter mehlei TaxID=2316080 RepID=A0A553V2D4_9HELI|nr:epoxyqueuosine reductase QueH [Helicobacter mehlei]TSA86649.1 epoxyqueuosine reductase QueH [Helicobacter mehlei]
MSAPDQILVHICCSVDSHYFLQELARLYPTSSLVGFFYNPNIHPYEEYLLRLQDVKRSCAHLDIALIEGEYALSAWLEAVKGLEQEKEKGARCNVCFDVRLEACAKLALMLGVQHFSTTLLSSPMKEQVVLKQQGEKIAGRYRLEFLYLNVRAQGGVTKQNALAKRDKLYRQNYCGCQFALNDQRQAQDKPCMELISPLSRQIHPASITKRLQVFSQRDELEQSRQDYQLLQQSLQTYLLLRGVVHVGDQVIPSVILNHSMSKQVVIKDLTIQLYSIEATLAEQMLAQQHHLEIKPLKIMLGVSVKDESLFLDHRGVATLLNLPSFTPLSYEQELHIRQKLVGLESIQPIIIVPNLGLLDAPINLEIVAQTFTHKNFYLLKAT